MATQNSIESYLILKDTGELGNAQKQVYDFIADHPDCSYNDISRGLGLHHNTATARIKELRDLGYVITSGTKTDSRTNKRNNTYRIRMADEDPDDTTVSGRPKLPREIFDFLKERTTKDAPDGRAMAIQSNVRILDSREDRNVSLKYCDFVNIRNILLVCEVIEQNKYVISGVNFTVTFRIK